MSQNDEIRRDSKEKQRGKGMSKLKEEKNVTKSVNSSGRKITAHSGLYFQIKLKKPVDFMTESKNEKVDGSSFSTKKNEPQKTKKEDESILLTSMDSLEISKRPAIKLCDTESHTDERETDRLVLHQCDDISCNCSKNVKFLHAVCSPQRSKMSELPEVGKDAKGLHSTLDSKSIRIRQTTNSVVKEEKTEMAAQLDCSQLKPQKSRLSKLRAPITYNRCKPTNISEIQHVNVVSQSTTVLSVDATEPKCMSNIGASNAIMNANATEPKCVSNTGQSNAPTKISPTESKHVSNIDASSESSNVNATEIKCVSITWPSSEHREISTTESECVSNTGPPSDLMSVLATEPKSVSNTETSSEPRSPSGSEPSSSFEPTVIGSDTVKLLSPSKPSNVHASMTSSTTGSDLTNVVESQSSSRPAFWPPSAPTYKIIHSLEPSTVPLIPRKCREVSEPNCEPPRASTTVPPRLNEPQSSKIAKLPQKCASTSRISRIPKINQNSETKMGNCGNPSGSKVQGNLKQTVVKTSSYAKKSTTAKTICDSSGLKQSKSTEKKVEVSQKRSCK